MGSEVWQFLMILPGFATVSWHIVVYLPGGTLGRWEAKPGRRPVRVARTGP